MPATKKAKNPNLSIWDAVSKTPQEAKKTIIGGRLKGMTDISPMLRIKLLTHVFGPCGVGWKTINETFYQVSPEGTPEVALICELDLTYVDPESGNWSEPVHGVGGSKLFVREASGLYLNDEAYKMAETDAISVACKKLGVCADTYWSGEERTKYMFDSEVANNEHPITPEEVTKPPKAEVDVLAKELAEECARELKIPHAFSVVLNQLKNKGIIPDKNAYEMSREELTKLTAEVRAFIKAEQETKLDGQKS